MNDVLKHYGVGHDKGGHSGRYAWGSGKGKEKSGIRNKKDLLDRLGFGVTNTQTNTEQKKHNSNSSSSGSSRPNEKSQNTQNQQNQQNQPPKESTIDKIVHPDEMSKYTLQEIRDMKNRIDAELGYKQAYDKLNPPKEDSKLQSAIKTVWKDAIKPAAIENAKKLVSGFLDKKVKELLGSESSDPNSLEVLKKEAERLKYKAEMSKNQLAIDKNDGWYKDQEAKKQKAAKEAAQKEVDAYNAQREQRAQEQKPTYRVDPNNAKEYVDPNTYYPVPYNSGSIINAVEFVDYVIEDLKHDGMS